MDAHGQAHARRWTHRQSGLSAVREATRSVLIVIEGVHASAREDVDELAQALAQAVEKAWGARAQRGELSSYKPVFAFG